MPYVTVCAMLKSMGRWTVFFSLRERGRELYMRAFLSAFLLITFVASGRAADGSLRGFIADYDASDRAGRLNWDIFVLGVAAGLATANNELSMPEVFGVAGPGKPFFCPPDEFRPNERKIIEMLRSASRQREPIGKLMREDSPPHQILLVLQKLYPCKPTGQ